VNKFPKAGVAVVPTVEAVEEPEFTDPNQINLLDQIAEIEAIEAVETLIENSESNKEDEEELVCPEPSTVIEEPEVESEFAAEDNIEDTVIYTDPAGNTFEAPIVEAVEEPKVERLSLDDILIRIPNEEKAKEEASTVDIFDEPDLSLDLDEEEESDSIPDFF
jgi:hypothetical protein